MKNQGHFKNKTFAVVIVFVFAAKTVFFADTKIVLAEGNPETTLVLDTPPFEPITRFFGDTVVNRVLTLKDLATSGSDKVSDGVYAVGDQVASVGEAVADAAHTFYCTVSGWLGVECGEKTTPVIETPKNVNVNIDVTTPPVINRKDDDTAEVRTDVRKEYNSSDDDSTSNNSNIINQTVIVNGVTEAELERRLAIFRNSLDLSSGVTIINKSVEGSRISTDRIYDDMNDAANEAAEDAITGGNLSFSGINGTFSGDVSISGTLSVTGTTTLSGPLSVGGSTGVAGYVLQSTGTGAQWVATSTLGITGGGGSGSGVDALAPIGSTANACGGSISGTTLTLQPASATFGGIVTTSAQTFAGQKTFDVNFGVGTSTVDHLFHAYGTQGSKFTRSGAIGGVTTVLNLLAADTGSLADGEGPGLSFRVSDSNQAEVTLGRVSALRTGADNSGSLVFSTTNAGSCIEQMTILPTGEVGVGTTTPSQLLDVVKNQNTGTYARTANNDSGTAGIAGFISAAQNANLQILAHGGGRVATRYGVSLANVAEVLSNTGASALLLGTASQNVPIVFGNNAVEVMRIDTNQRLGLGTTTPAAKQHIISTTEQVRVGYNSSNYYSTTVASNGAVTFNAEGSGAGFAFGDAVQLSSLTTDGFVKTCGSNGTLYVDTASYLSCVNNLSAIEVGNANTVSGCATSAALGYQNTVSNASSTAFGITNTASGLCSSAIGNCNTASGTRTSAIGRSNEAGNVNSSAVGYANCATGCLGSAFGYCNLASGEQSASAFGRSNIASATSTSAFGISSCATGGCSTAVGRLSCSTGGFSTAVGNTSVAGGTGSSAFGFVSTASGAYSSALGYCNGATTLNSVVVGRSNFTGTGVASVNFGILNNSSGGTITVATGVVDGTPIAVNSGASSVALGICNCSTGQTSATVGHFNKGTAQSSLGFGNNNNVTGACAAGFGHDNTISNTGAFTVGKSNTVSGVCSYAFGHNITNSTDSVDIGISDTAKIRINSSGVDFINAGFLVCGCAGTAGQVLTSSGAGIAPTWTTVSGGSFDANAISVIQVGCSNSASGYCASGFGAHNNATGLAATAIGTLNCAEGAYSTAIGGYNHSCENAIASGYSNNATGVKSSALGYMNQSFGQCATASGYVNTASGYATSAFGALNDVTGQFASTFGYDNCADGYGSTAAGACTSATGECSSAFGYGLTNIQSNSTKIGPGNEAALHICSTGSAGIFQFIGSGAIENLELDSSGFFVNGGTSDERLKNIDGAFTSGLSELNGINPISFHWKDISGRDTNRMYSGFSAQNILATIPEAVTLGNDGYYSVKDRPILAASVNAIKQLNVKSLTTDALALQNAADIVSIKTLLGTEGMSTTTLARFETLDVDVTNVHVIMDAQAEEIVTLSDRMDEMVSRLESFGATVYESMVTFVDVIARKITASEIIINNEEHPEKTGLIIYDRKTGEPICIYFENGDMKTQEGECEEVEENDADDNTENNTETPDENSNDTSDEPTTDTEGDGDVVEDMIDDTESGTPVTDEGDSTTDESDTSGGTSDDSGVDSGSEIGDTTDFGASTDTSDTDNSDTDTSTSDVGSDSSSDTGGDSGSGSDAGNSGESSSTE